ncbi:glycosyltransferase [Parabacteroides gordonii]|uniref:glycosyltransferase n=1 Tax=Parabacteroides gordonii TaxID=574930 RepID=UPI0026EAA2BE|nr:glycosyltransferase [Parabacteroides gordonii]
MTNVLFYNTYPIDPEHGGTERVTDLVAHYLKSVGYTIYYLVRVDMGKSLENADIRTFFLPDSTRGDSPENISFLDRLLEKLQIDILINQDVWNDDIYLCNHNVLKTETKIISTIHTSIDSGFRNFNELCKWEYSWSCPVVSTRSLLRRIRMPYFKKRIYKLKKKKMNFMNQYTDTIVVLSPKYIEEFEELIGIPCSTKIVAIPNPLTFSNIEVKTMEQKENCILFVGRLSYPEKRVDRLLYIWHKIQYRLPGWKLELVGDGKERRDLEILAEKLELKNVFFHGYQSPLAYYAKAKIVSLVSNFEGFNMFILEGMQNGCVPISFSSFAAVTDAITDGVNGYLIEPFDLDAYAEKLYELASNPSLLSKMQSNAVRAVDQYSIEKIGPEWLALFQSLLNK